MKKRTLSTALFAILIVLSFAFYATAADLPGRLDWSTHRAGSGAAAMSMGFGTVASENGPIMVVVAPTSGPLSYVKQVNDVGNPQLGNGNSLDIFWMYFNEVSTVPIPDQMLGNKPFYPQAFKNLRLIAASGRMAVGFLVRDKSPYKKVTDLKGARLASGYLAQPSAFSPLVADLVNVGMSLKDFKQVAVTSPAAGVPALGENRVDVVHCAVGMAQTAQVDSKIKVRYLSAGTDPAGVKRAMSIVPGASYPIWQPGPPGLLEPMPLLTFAQNIFCNKNLPDAVVESLLSTWWDNIDKLRPLHPTLSRLTSPKMLFEPRAAMPYHSGAIKFYKKKGIWDAKQDVYQKRILNNEKPFTD